MCDTWQLCICVFMQAKGKARTRLILVNGCNVAVIEIMYLFGVLVAAKCDIRTARSQVSRF